MLIVLIVSHASGGEWHISWAKAVLNPLISSHFELNLNWGKEQVLFDAELSVGLASKEIFAAQNLEYSAYFYDEPSFFESRDSDSVP